MARISGFSSIYGYLYTCEVCGKEFRAKRRKGVKTCSPRCRKRLSIATLKAERS